MEVAGVEPASLVFSQVVSTCLDRSLLSSPERLWSGYPVSRLPDYHWKAEANLPAMPASRRLYPLAGVRGETLQLFTLQVRIVLRQLIFEMD